MGTRTPSRHLSLVTLETIAANNYTNKDTSKDYDVSEVNDLIWGKQATAQARAADQREKRLQAEQAILDELPPPIPAEACEGLPDYIIPHGQRSDLARKFAGGSWRIITARFDSKCRESHDWVEAGERVLWHKEEKCVYSEQSDTYKDYKQFFDLPF